MAKEVMENYSKYFFIASFIGIILLSIYLIKSYIITIIGAILLAYIFFPIYKVIRRAVRKKWLSSLITIILVVIIIIIPIIFAANALITESLLFFHNTKDLDLSKIEDSISPYIDKDIEISKIVTDTLNDFSLSIARSTSDFVVTLPKKILGLFVMLFLMYYLFLNGKALIEKIKGHIPLREKQKEELSKRFNSVIYASIYGIIVTAFVQGAIAALGFWIFGVSSPILWGLVSVVAAILPFIGASLVWLPAAIYKLAIGETFNGLGLLFYGIFIISTIDNVIRPGIVGSKGKVHPALVLLGVLGGLELFGFLGIIIGPLILSILTIFLDLYLLEKINKRPKQKKRV
jgi:predicted PurR-regulated permease PerM